MDSRVFICWIIIQYYHYSLCCSNCSFWPLGALSSCLLVLLICHPSPHFSGALPYILALISFIGKTFRNENVSLLAALLKGQTSKHVCILILVCPSIHPLNKKACVHDTFNSNPAPQSSRWHSFFAYL